MKNCPKVTSTMFSTFLSIFISFSTFHASLQYEYVLKIIDQFSLNNPYLIGSSTDISPGLVKSLFISGHFVRSHTQINEILLKKDITATNVILFLNPQSDGKFQLQLPENYHGTLFLITHNQSFEELLHDIAIQTKIDQKVFILKKDSRQEIHEAYTINDLSVKKKLGSINLITNRFEWQRNVNSDFIKRRSDFHGIVLKAMVEFSGLDMNANSSYLVNAPYFHNNESYRVNGFTYGLFNDILEIMQDELNFTTVLYKRKEPAWGYVYPQANGSYRGTGAIGDIFFKRADLAVGPFYNVIDRARYVNYLPDIRPYLAATYIPTTIEESINFDTYRAPFAYSLWIALAIMGTIFTTIQIFLLQFNDVLKHFGFNTIWSSFTVFFGEKPTSSPIDTKSYYKIATTTTLLCGTVIWMSYNASWTSDLSVTTKAYPFSDMNSFSKLNWR